MARLTYLASVVAATACFIGVAPSALAQQPPVAHGTPEGVQEVLVPNPPGQVDKIIGAMLALRDFEERSDRLSGAAFAEDAPVPESNNRTALDRAAWRARQTIDRSTHGRLLRAYLNCLIAGRTLPGDEQRTIAALADRTMADCLPEENALFAFAWPASLPRFPAQARQKERAEYREVMRASVYDDLARRRSAANRY